MKTLIQELPLAFPDWHVTVEDMFAQDNKVVTRWSLAATHLAPLSHVPGYVGSRSAPEGIHIDLVSSVTKSPNGGRAIILPRCSTGLEYGDIAAFSKAPALAGTARTISPVR